MGGGHGIQHLGGRGAGWHVGTEAEGDLELDAGRLRARHVPCAAGRDAARLQDRREDDRAIGHLHHLPADDRRGERCHHLVLDGEAFVVVLGQVRARECDAGTLPARGEEAVGDGGDAVFGHGRRGSLVAFG